MALSWLETITIIVLPIAIFVAILTQEKGHWSPIVKILLVAVFIFGTISDRFWSLIWPCLATFICEILLIVFSIISYLDRR